MIYLDNAATSWPKPEDVYETLGQFLRDAGANPGRAGHRMAVAAADAIAECRTGIARLINAESPDRVVFTSNTTDSLNMAILGLLRPGDHAITTSMEHNSVTRPLHLAERNGSGVTIVEASPDGWVDPAQIEAAILPETRLIVSTQGSNATGAAMPIAAFADIAQKQGILLLVDGAQTLGAMPVDVQRLGVDLFAFPGHKGLLGPTGTGGLYIGSRVDLEAFVPLRSGGTGVQSEDDEQPMLLPYRYEAGTVNTAGIAALAKGVHYVAERGVDDIAAHERVLMDRLVAGLSATGGVFVFPVRNPDERAAVVSFVIEGWTPADAGAVLDQTFDIACRVGLHCAPMAMRTIDAMPRGTIRFSPGPFTTEDEIDQAIDAIRELAASPLA